ncbi:MAG: lipopolysaccharide biosynthesis protein [Treponema sp.]|nr:lipopolysaccharide biosynthesis protein [Treponema sp.]
MEIENQNIENKTEENKNDEISLIDLFAVVMKYIKMEIIIVASAMLFAVTISVISIKLPPEKSFLPNKYKSQANMLINDSSSSGGGLASAIAASGLGGLMGISTSGGSSYSSLATYLSTSNPFLDAIVDNFNILAREEFQKSKHPLSDSRKWLSGKLKASIDDNSGVFTISCTDIDPAFAQAVVNFSVDWLSNRFDELGIDKNKIQKANLEKNIDASFAEIQKLQKEVDNVAYSVSHGSSAYNIPSITLTTTKLQMELNAQQEVYKQLKTQYELLKVQMASETPVFQILERPEIPDQKAEPSRGKLCIIITFAAAFMAIFIAFLRNAIENIKKDPEAMSKLKFGKKRR